MNEDSTPARPNPYSQQNNREYQEQMLAAVRKVESAMSISSERKVNNVWEYTQSVIAVFVVVTTCGGVLWFSAHENRRMPPEWWTIAGLVIGFYFGRVRPLAQTPHRRATDKEKE
jgi:hypothetical protein